MMVALLFASCTSQSVTNLSYSSEFTIALPSQYVEGSSIFYADELGVKTSAGKVIAGQIITNEKDSLPDNFDIRLYPEYLLKIRSVTDLSADVAKKFENTANEIEYSYGLSSLEVKQEENRIIYSVCKKDTCLAFVVKPNVKDQIFYAHTQKIEREEFIHLLTGGLNVKQ
jgi:hypothetical protein